MNSSNDDSKTMTPLKNWSLPRRTFLRGLGTAIALPVLESMLPKSVAATASSPHAPHRNRSSE